MGFGSGYSHRYERGSRRVNNSQVAHIWAQGEGGSAQSGNGNFFFNDSDIWSYGSHFLVGRIMADGVALLNNDSHSVSTSGHQSDASSAVSHRDVFYIGKLTELHDTLRTLDGRFNESKFNADAKKAIRRELLAHANHLTRRRNACRWHSDGKEEGEQAGAYLCRRAGLPPATWPAILKERKRLDDKAKKAAKAKESANALAMATRYATMTDVEWREYMRKDNSKYERFYERVGVELYHAGRLAKAKGFSATRRAILKSRRADALRRKAGYDGAEASFKRWAPIRQAIAIVRSARDVLATVPPLPVTTRESAVAHLRSRLGQLSNCQAFPQETQLRLLSQSEALSRIGADMASEVDAYKAAERERQDAERLERMRLDSLERADKIAAWLAGQDVRVSFDADSGGAAIRIKGDQLETSHGASVPLEHAVRAFRFVKLVRQRGEGWERNGKTIRVGHFQIDRIAANGDFKAGCHRFTWPEVERAAALAGVLDAAADDSAVIASAGV